MSDDVSQSPRLIKRYANRKLYDLRESRYITLDEIAELIRLGEELRIIDNTSKEDLTSVTLTQIIYEEGKKRPRTMPLAALRQIIQSGGDLWSRHVTQPVSTLRDEAERTLATLRDEVERQIARLSDRERDMADQIRNGFREWALAKHKAIEDAQRLVDEGLKVVAGSVPTLRSYQRELEDLRRRVQALEHTPPQRDEPEPPP